MYTPELRSRDVITVNLKINFMFDKRKTFFRLTDIPSVILTHCFIKNINARVIN